MLSKRLFLLSLLTGLSAVSMLSVALLNLKPHWTWRQASPFDVLSARSKK